jgi:dTDP-4-amino-4,6-dideoxygalactose transaminase
LTAPRKLAIEGGDPIRDDYLPFGRPDIGDEEVEAVAEVLRSGWIGLGARTREFEGAFAEYVGADHAVAVASCTAALHLSLVAHGVGPGDDVITSGLTFAATVNAILATGARPVFVDVDRRTLNLDPAGIEAMVTDRTAAIMPVHFGGLPCDHDALSVVARRHDLAVVEDAAHAVGAELGGVRVGGHGPLACFSFYPNKNMTTGEGGMITLGDAAAADELKVLRLHGLSADAWKRYASKEIVPSLVTRHGWKYNMTDIQAALGLVQLGRLEAFQARREQMARSYDDAFSDLPVDLQERHPGRPGHRHALHLYVLLLRLEDLTADRERIVLALRAENIGAAVHYAGMYQHPWYREELGMERGQLPNADWVTDRTVSLPLSPSMTERDVDDVITVTRSVLLHYRRS